MLFRIAFVLSSLISLMGAGAAGAVTFNFSFTDMADNGGLVRGHFIVPDNTTEPAVSVRITSAFFGVGEYVAGYDGLPNSFTVADGVLTTFSFLSMGRFNNPPWAPPWYVVCCTLGFRGTVGGVIEAGLFNRSEGVSWVNAPDFTVTRVLEGQTPLPPPAPVPLPAPLLMLLAALGGFGLVGRSRKAALAAP